MLPKVVVINENKPEEIEINKKKIKQVRKETPEIKKKTKSIYNEWGEFELVFVLEKRENICKIDPERLSNTLCVIIETRDKNIMEKYSQNVLNTFERVCDKIGVYKSNHRNHNIQSSLGFHPILVFGSRNKGEGLKDDEKHRWEKKVRSISHGTLEFAAKIVVKNIHKEGNGDLKMMLKRTSMRMAHNRKMFV